MDSFTIRAARHLMAIKAARVLKNELLQVGMDSLNALADDGRSVVQIYLDGSSAKRKAEIKQEWGRLLQSGVTVDMVFSALAKMPELMPIMEKRRDYMRSELQKFAQFLEEEAKKQVGKGS